MSDKNPHSHEQAYYIETFNHFKDELGWLGENVTLESFSGNQDLQKGLLRLEGIYQNPPKSIQYQPLSFQQKEKLGDFIKIANDEGITTKQINQFQLLIAPDLFQGVYRALDERDIDLSEFKADNSSGISGNLPS